MCNVNLRIWTYFQTKVHVRLHSWALRLWISSLQMRYVCKHGELFLRLQCFLWRKYHSFNHNSKSFHSCSKDCAKAWEQREVTAKRNTVNSRQCAGLIMLHRWQKGTTDGAKYVKVRGKPVSPLPSSVCAGLARSIWMEAAHGGLSSHTLTQHHFQNIYQNFPGASLSQRLTLIHRNFSIITRRALNLHSTIRAYFLSAGALPGCPSRLIWWVIKHFCQ